MDKVSAMYMWLVNNGYPTNDETLTLAKAMTESEEDADQDCEDDDEF